MNVTNNKWQALKFKDFITLQRGFDLPVSEMKLGDYPVLGSTSIIGYHNSYKCEPPGVATGRSGSIGSVLYTDKKYWPHNTSLWVKNFKGNNPRFVYYFLSIFPLNKFNAGAGVPTLNRNHLDQYDILIPVKNLQDKMVDILFSLDKLIERNEYRIKLLEQMAQLLYREWFVEFRFPGYEKYKFVDSELGKIPVGWHIESVKSIGKIVTGKTPSTQIQSYFNGSYMFIKTPDMLNKMFVLNTEETLTDEGIKSQPSQTIPENSICVSCIGTGGVTSITTSVCQTNQQINSIIPNKIYDLEWAYYTIKNLKPYIELYGATGATMTNLSKGKLASLKIIYPENQIRVEFNSKVFPIFQLIKNLLSSNFVLIQTRDLLLPKLMSGDIDVSKLDIKGLDN